MHWYAFRSHVYKVIDSAQSKADITRSDVQTEVSEADSA